MKKSVPQQILDFLYAEGINSLIVEGGLQTHNSFISSGLWDEARVIKGTVTFRNGTPAPVLIGVPVEKEQVENDIIEFFYNTTL
jgi:diaminohydroxyphosphoribosylaminopyrimidine deaminase/5-amino-6-(5-phosphoribosylamino)uracil reductase